MRNKQDQTNDFVFSSDGEMMATCIMKAFPFFMTVIARKLQ